MSLLLDRPKAAYAARVPEVDDCLVVRGFDTPCGGSDVAAGVPERAGWGGVASLEEQMTDAPSPRARKGASWAEPDCARHAEAPVVTDPGVAAAIEFVRDHISEVFGVEALLRVSRMPRRSLEIAFRQVVGCTPYEYIRRARVARAKAMLAAPGGARTLTQVAAACGFRDLRRFRLVFLRDVGISPSEYRAARRVGRE